jgi:AhpD family alkylhydroperoxidase
MTTTTSRIDVERAAPELYRAMLGLDGAVGKSGLDPQLQDLLKFRVAQMNGCAYCMDMHAKDARAAGETEQRIYALPAWQEAPFFTDRERAALAFTESVTLLTQTHVPTADYDAVAAVFTETEVAALLGLILTVNAWNTIGVAARAWQPGSYEP